MATKRDDFPSRKHQATFCSMAKAKSKDKRANRSVEIGEAVGGAIGPMLKKRGFASRDLITHWSVIVPAPYDKSTMPDRLSWPRGGAATQGAILFIRCAEAHRLAFAHESQSIASAINRYFGYVVVDVVKLSAAPFSPRSDKISNNKPEPEPQVRAVVNDAIADVADEGIREALRRLGHGLMSQNK